MSAGQIRVFYKTCYIVLRHSVGTYQENELTRNSPGNTRPQSSQLAEPLWTDLGVKRGISARKLISSKKKKKSAGRERMVEHCPKIFGSEEKATTMHARALKVCASDFLFLSFFVVVVVVVCFLKEQ